MNGTRNLPKSLNGAVAALSLSLLASSSTALAEQPSIAPQSLASDASIALQMAPDDIVTYSRANPADAEPAPEMVSQPVVQAEPPKPAAKSGPFMIKRILPIDGPIKYGEWFWDDEGVPPGPLVMTVDLEARVLSVWRGGYEIGATAVLLGTDEHPTPLGTFPILTKEKDNVSEKYDNAPMPWTLRLTWDGIAIHGSPVANGYASHGCIGTPDEFAEKLFAIARKGDRVVITRGRMIGMGDSIL